MSKTNDSFEVIVTKDENGNVVKSRIVHKGDLKKERDDKKKEEKDQINF